MKRFYQTLFLSLLIPLGAYAQADTTASFTLDDCIRYALENTIDVKNARIDEQISQAKVKETTGLGLPQIDGSVNITDNPKLSRIYQKYDASSDGVFGDLSQIPGIKDGDVVAFQNFFQLRSSADAGLNINQLLFSSTYLVGLKAASTYKQLSFRTTEQTKITTIEKVTKAFYAVLIDVERVGRLDNNIARLDSTLKTTKAMNENGFTEAIDVDRLQVNLNNLKTDRLKTLNLQNLNLLLLKFQMNYPIDKPLVVKGDLNVVMNDNLFSDYEQGWDYKNRIEYKVLETQRELQRLNVKNKQSNGHPQLTANAGLGYSTQSDNLGGLFKTKSDIADFGPIGPDKWYPYSRIGLTLSIPIFSGLQRTYQVQQEKLALLKIENNFASLKQNIDLSIQQNSITYRNSVESLKSQQENLALADKVARITKIKYEQGVGSNIEVIDAEGSVRDAQVNYYNALYDALIAKVDLDKAFAKLDPVQYETKK